MHNWDRSTPIEETTRALDDLVRAGKIRSLGFSNTPAWVTAKAQTMAQLKGWTPLIALQVEYSLLARTVEGELAPPVAVRPRVPPPVRRTADPGRRPAARDRGQRAGVALTLDERGGAGCPVPERDRRATPSHPQRRRRSDGFASTEPGVASCHRAWCRPSATSAALGWCLGTVGGIRSVSGTRPWLATRIATPARRPTAAPARPAPYRHRPSAGAPAPFQC
ncbi:aldo/keto reductase [Crossiella sp. NPDC003009]